MLLGESLVVVGYSEGSECVKVEEIYSLSHTESVPPFKFESLDFPFGSSDIVLKKSLISIYGKEVIHLPFHAFLYTFINGNHWVKPPKIFYSHKLSIAFPTTSVLLFRLLFLSLKTAMVVCFISLGDPFTFISIVHATLLSPFHFYVNFVFSSFHLSSLSLSL